MHELSIASSILDLVRQHVPDGRLSDVRAIEVRVGRLSGVVGDSLAFSFEALVRDTELSGAELVIEDVPLRCRCRSCRAEFELIDPIFSCSSCGQPGLEVLSGTELQVVQIELADAPAEVP